MERRLILRGFLAGAFGVVTVTAARALGPKDPTPQKLMPYECGITDLDPTVERFPVRFYLVAMLFVIFDVEVIARYILAKKSTAAAAAWRS